MSDIGNYYGSFESAEELEANGNLLEAAIEYWLCTQYYEHGEFPTMPDTSLESKASSKLKRLQSKLPYAPLSKTSFIKGFQCLKALWLYRNKYDQRFVPPEVQQKFNIGHIIGEMAQHLFPNGIDASHFESVQSQLRYLQTRTPLKVPDMPFRLKQNLWLKQTKGALERNELDVYEAAFLYDGVFAAVDVLHLEKSGDYIAYEVKSSYDIKDVYIHDCALQYYVISHNIKLADMYLVYPDEEYVKSLGIEIEKLNINNCDVEKLFIKKSIHNEILAMQPTIEVELKKIKLILSQIIEPKQNMGEQCGNPYECDFLHYCSSQKRKGIFSFLSK